MEYLIEAPTLQRAHLDLLLDNTQILAIRIPHFLSSAVCTEVVASINQHGFDFYQNVTPRVGRIGIAQNEFKRDAASKLAYFAEAPHAHAVRKTIFERGYHDVLPDVMQLVGNAWGNPTRLATEPTGASYFAGMVRMIPSMQLHFDWAQHDARDWAISEIAAQLTWNIYLEVGSGGDTIVYQREWQRDDNSYKIPGSYAYAPAVVAGRPSVAVKPQVGDLVLFNSRNYHKVLTTDDQSERISFTSFIGLMSTEQELVFWS